MAKKFANSRTLELERRGKIIHLICKFINYSYVRYSSRLPRARASVPEDFVTPLVVPNPPRRVYFLFNTPFDTNTLDAYNKTACKIAYQEVQSRVKESVDLLINFRKDDKYDQFFPRFVYERTNPGSQAPTAPLPRNINFNLNSGIC